MSKLPIYDGEGLRSDPLVKATGAAHPVDPSYRAITMDDLLRAAAARKTRKPAKTKTGKSVRRVIYVKGW